ncbi:hypothetical protein HWV07_12350 [Natronomonas salina]|uniref:DUF5789 family protein n=1 Tax=Natronomonas salina TaxID=1710540 RepID=UPI0015B4F6B0|nr:hypothetical protein [Natronomonas salina]QLD89775.1 hypothetical protein HWV07_12350 [Natronomonas salina]
MNDEMGDPQESANERRHEQVEAVEEILDSVDPNLEEHSYPVSSEELSARYGSTDAELPNETESLGSVFDRLDDQEYDSPMAVKEEVLRAASDASPEPPNAGDGRAVESDHGGTPQEVIDDLETEEVAEATRQDAPNDAGGAGDVGTPADAAAGPEADAAEPGDAMTPDSTEPDEFAPQESIEDRDREGDRRASAERSSDRGDPWEAAEDEPGDPAEPTAEPSEEELDPELRESEVPDARDEADASEPSSRARREGEDGEPLEGTAEEDLEEGEAASSQVPDAREEDADVTREGNVPDSDDGDE